jgi:HEAT repeat protein
LPVLIDALRYSSRTQKSSKDEITSCFLLIGSPDATQALIGVWQQLSNLNDNDATAELICGIWRSLSDRSMLPVLCSSSAQTPSLFLETISVFGDEALPDLRTLASDKDPDRRIMALRGLERIAGNSGAHIVAPLLRDCNPEVRSLAASTLEAVSGPVTTLNALVVAHRAGFSTATSVQMLVLYNPPELFALLAGLLTRYDPDRSVIESGKQAPTSADTVGAAREAALAFVNCPWPHAQVTQILCGVTNRGVHPSIISAIALAIAERGRAGDDSDILAYKTMYRQLTIVNRDARAASAAALVKLGEPLGARLEALLDSGRPQGNLLRNLQSALVNSQDVGQAMSEAVQHVTTWFNRVSRVTAKRFSTDAVEDNLTDAALKDGRTPELLRKLQANVLDSLERAESAEETIEAVSLGVGTVRALARLGGDAAQLADNEIKRTYTFVRSHHSEDSISAGNMRGSENDPANMLREAAGQALIAIHGSACLDTLTGGLNHQDDAVKVTSALTLARLGDRRAAPLLQPLLDSGSAAVARAAREALTAIKRGNPEMMTLLRSSSSADARPDTLLRPSTGVSDALSSELLLRPAHPGQPDQ